MSTVTAWENRIVGYGEVAPDQLLAHFANSKIHPDAQTQALKGVLAELGWIDSIKVSVDSGRVIDGHDRIKAAMQAQQPTVPVTYVKLTEDEELYALATFDPVGALAGQDAALLAELLADVQTGDAAVQALLDSLKTDAADQMLDQVGAVETVPEQWMVLIDCTGEAQQADLLDRLVSEGYACRALTS